MFIIPSYPLQVERTNQVTYWPTCILELVNQKRWPYATSCCHPTVAQQKNQNHLKQQTIITKRCELKFANKKWNNCNNWPFIPSLKHVIIGFQLFTVVVVSHCPTQLTPPAPPAQEAASLRGSSPVQREIWRPNPCTPAYVWAKQNRQHMTRVTHSFGSHTVLWILQARWLAISEPCHKPSSPIWGTSYPVKIC